MIVFAWFQRHVMKLQENGTEKGDADGMKMVVKWADLKGDC